MRQSVARGNIQHISYILQIEQDSPFGLMLLLGMQLLRKDCIPYMEVKLSTAKAIVM